jgi:hypothetical protein
VPNAPKQPSNHSSNIPPTHFGESFPSAAAGSKKEENVGGGGGGWDWVRRKLSKTPPKTRRSKSTPNLMPGEENDGPKENEEDSEYSIAFLGW